MKKGFTLIELLIALSVTIVVGSVVASTLYGTLRGSNKSTTIATVKQSGDTAITSMAKTIRDANTLNGIYPCITPVSASTLVVTDVNNNTTTYACDGVNSTITANGQNLIDTASVALNPSMVCSTMFNCSQASVSSSPVIQIKFSLAQKNASTTVEKSSTVSFQTTVEMRNLGR